jgi:hypothetical protein
VSEGESAAGRSPSQQLDLFIDGRDAIVIHEAVTGLVARDADRAATALTRLEREHPAHPDLAALVLLMDALGPTSPSPPTHATVMTRIDEMDRRLAPAARRFLGAAAPRFLRPLWQGLAAAAASLPFDDGHPRAHPGWLCQQYGDWGAVRAAVEAERDWRANPLLRHWMGLAQHHLGEPEAAIRLWLPLCWTEPALFASQAPLLPSAPVREAWEAFERATLVDEELVGSTDATAWFPAWLLVRLPGLANLFRIEEIAESDDAPRRAFRTLLVLLPLERRAIAGEVIGQRRGPADDVIGQRRALRNISPAFFHHYLDAVSGRPRSRIQS